jgi:cytochrome P450
LATPAHALEQQAAAQSATGRRAPSLPDGPSLPRFMQTFGFLFLHRRWLDYNRRHYGDVVKFSTLFDPCFVMVFDPESVKQVFRASPEQLRAGEANAPLGPVLGERSVLLLDGAEHLRQRRLMLPPFHGERMREYEEVMQEAADRAIDAWPVGETFELLPSMQSLTLDVIMTAVFGIEQGPRQEELKRRIRAVIDPVGSRPALLLMVLSGGRFGIGGRMQRFEERKRALDDLIYEEIANRRAAPDLEERKDVLSMLLLARDEDGQAMSDRELRDELVTLLVAGHETTATGLAWAFELGDYVIPDGVEINPSIAAIHRRPDCYPEPQKFMPERFLGSDAPDNFTWIPFGGSTRRCLGASFASFEMRVVIRRVVERAHLTTVGRPEKALRRGVTIVPKRGVRVMQTAIPG